MMLSHKTVIAFFLTVFLLVAPAACPVNARQMYATDSVNLRQAADGESEILTTIKPGTVVKSSGSEGNWIRVKAKGYSGYIYKSYLTASYAKLLKKGITIPSYINSNKVNLRKKAGFQAKVIKTLKSKAKVEIISQDGNWLKVRTTKGKKGYVYAAYVGSPNSALAKKAAKALKAYEKKAGKAGKTTKKTKKKETEVRPAGNYDPSHVSESSCKYREEAIEYAEGRLGDKYSQKKRNRKGYADCSSLIRDAYEEAAETYVGGDTVSQTAVMTDYFYKIGSLSEVNPGDLVYHLTGDNHTGIYLGDGQVLHASQSSGKVKISSYEDGCTYWEFGCDAASYCDDLKKN